MKQSVKDPILLGFAERLQKACDAQGIGDNRAEIARVFNLARQSVIAYLEGKSLPSVAKGIEIAQKLDVDFEWLMTGKVSSSREKKLNIRTMEATLEAMRDAKAMIGSDVSIKSEALMLVALYQYIELTQQSGKSLDFDACRSLARTLISDQEESSRIPNDNLKSAS